MNILLHTEFCGRAIFFFQQVSSELGNYVLKQMMFLKQLS